MEIRYHSTRNNEESFTASQAILKGLCDDGGLFVPSEIPPLPMKLSQMKGKSYQEIAFLIMREFLSDFTDEELRTCIDRAYDAKFDTKEIAPVVKVGDAYHIELFHGKTIAFKDMALSILPHLLTTAAKKNRISNEIVILTATSGDTGKAAMAGFADVPGTRIIVFYPKGGVSRIQELQMVTQKGENTSVVGIEGNFDDAQNGVKAMFEDAYLREDMLDNGMQFSSANSINIGRLVPQIVYYVASYVRLLEMGAVKEDEAVNITVPTGNFGNILAAWYAGQMGLPIHKLICASNKNKVLYDFFQTGTYNKNREFYLTSSPSMDILISSNLERMIYIAAGQDAEKTTELMKELKETGSYTITPEMQEKLALFASGFATEEDTFRAINHTYRENGYVMDPHTAVAAAVYEDYLSATKDLTPTLIASTASPYKFAQNVLGAIEPSFSAEDDEKMMEEIKKLSGCEIPQAISELFGAEIRHKRVCRTNEMEKTVREILSI